MKISAVIVSRNDNYGGNLIERSSYCFQSAIDTYDEVIYVDWNSEEQSLLYEVKDNIKFKGNFKHIVIPPDAAKILTNYDEHAQVCCEVLGRNIGIRRATGDYIISTNIDIIAPRRDTLEAAINSLEPNSFYVFSRCDVDLPEILEFHGGECKYNDYDNLRKFLTEGQLEKNLQEVDINLDDKEQSVVDDVKDEMSSILKTMDAELAAPLKNFPCKLFKKFIAISFNTSLRSWALLIVACDFFYSTITSSS